ncbi:hypothetical protein EL17_04435 [Anditalea andensis]|uniref:Uncharacterized protein n=1 Tax=Anditalea andensis TaxID=1048983 RepID=A0A074L347_9BACT|nr:hypothetical protein EL17_04435 [Anditalea andensis]
MIKVLLVILLIASTLVGGYLLVSEYLFKSHYNAVQLVPSDAVMVFETTEPIQTWNQMVSQPLWERLSDIPSLKKFEGQLVALDSLMGGSGKLDKTLKGNQMVISFHTTGKEEFDFLFSIAFRDSQENEDFFKNFQSSFQEDTKKNKRNYSGIAIYEIERANDANSFSFAIINNVLIGSYTSFLVEDAIRRTKNKRLKNFKDEYPELFRAAPKGDGLGIIRVSHVGLANFLQTIGRTSGNMMQDTFSKNRMSANLQVRFDNNKLYLDGAYFYKGGNELKFPKVSAGGNHVFGHLIPNRTAVLTQYKVKDPRMVKHITNDAFLTKSTLKGDLQQSFPEEEFFDLLNGEMIYMIMEEENGSQESDQILLLKSKDAPAQFKKLKEFGTGTAQSRMLISDFHRNKEIFSIGEEDFPAHVFEGQFVGFADTYITYHEDVLVWGNSLKSVKRFLDDLENDNTWGKTLNKKKLLDAIVKESGYNFVLNLPRFWNSLLESSSPKWTSLLQKYAPQIKSIDVVSFQLEEKGNEQLIHMEIGYSITPYTSISDIVLQENLSVRFNSDLIYGPKVVRNFADNSTEYLVQDDLGRVHLITEEGDLVFSEYIEGEIISDISQIDYYKNGKLQMVFATENALYGYDRLGNLLPDFPISLPNGNLIDYFSLLDYENTRDYRFFVATTTGELYLFDKYGEIMEGWSPKRTPGSLSTRPAHHRIPGLGDYMVAVSKTGEIHMLNRRGELQAGEGINVGQGISNPYIVQQRGRSAETQMVTITDEGEVVSINFKGEFTDRKQLYRPDRSSTFHLVKDQSDDRYLFIVHDYNRISVLNPETEVMFEKNLSTESVIFQLFSFGGDRSILVVIDQTQEFIYLYNLKGDLLNTRPISGKHRIDVRYSPSRNEYSIYSIHENILSEYRMPF